MSAFFRFVLVLALFLPVSAEVLPQGSTKKNLFRSPVDYPITLSGAFGELRRNHFHSGIDIRTGGVQGKPIYAIADGYVSRVNVSPVGFGKALYLVHPNGYTSVYGHLKSYAGTIAEWVKAQQYERESFAIDLEVTPGRLKVKKGDIVAYSGNSGSSGGPHIHFEIRDTQNQEIIDPLDFGFVKPDGVPPGISAVRIYPMDEHAMVNNSAASLTLAVAGSAGSYRLQKADTPRVSGNVIFAVETSDHPAGGLKTGVHIITLKVDGNLIFSQDIDRFAFSETRYANSLMDYPAFIRQKRKFQRSYVAPNNRLRIYRDVVNNGVVHFSSAGLHQVQYEVTDAFGNRSVLSFFVRSHPPAPSGRQDVVIRCEDSRRFTYTSDNRFVMPDLKLEIPGEALYADLCFKYETSPRRPNTYSAVHHLHDPLTPLHTWCRLAIRPDDLPEALKSKAVIVSIDPSGRMSSAGGTWEQGWLTTRIREFSAFAVATDSEKPVIKPVNVFHNKNVKKQSTIQVRISDNLAGIKTYKGTLNGRWILMDYDEKNRLLTYRFDDRMKAGRNVFILTVTDGVGNVAKYEATLLR